MSLYDIDVTAIDGSVQSMAAYRGKPLLIVNVASLCHYTPQYAGLETLYRKYKDRGLMVLGFPCDQFRRQEPASNAEIRQFCSTRYNVTFPMFAKINVNGAGAHPLYRFLQQQQKGIFGTRAIKWNFTKFLVNAQGDVVRRYAFWQAPEKIEAEIARQLGKKMPDSAP